MASRPLQKLWHYARNSHYRLPPRLATYRSGGPNLEVFKFGLYVMFPIAWMWYFGTNLETRFAVPDFWPEPGTTHTIPFEKEDLKAMGERLKADRLERRRRRLEQARTEMKGLGAEETPRIEEKVEQVEQKRQVVASDGTFGVGAIERWARGR